MLKTIKEIRKERKSRKITKNKSQLHLKINSKSLKLPMILTPRSYLDRPNATNTMSRLSLNLSLLGALPSIKIKSKIKDQFRESPILKNYLDEERGDHDIYKIIAEIDVNAFKHTRV